MLNRPLICSVCLRVLSVIPHFQELCRKLHKQIDLVDEERYDMELKVKKSNKEVHQRSFRFTVRTCRSEEMFSFFRSMT